jgi:hypothetical protein
MSASTQVKQGSLAGAWAGSSMPALAMQAARPNAFIAAVLPPVLGPTKRYQAQKKNSVLKVVVIA